MYRLMCAILQKVGPETSTLGGSAQMSSIAHLRLKRIPGRFLRSTLRRSCCPVSTVVFFALCEVALILPVLLGREEKKMSEGAFTALALSPPPSHLSDVRSQPPGATAEPVHLTNEAATLDVLPKRTYICPDCNAEVVKLDGDNRPPCCEKGHSLKHATNGFLLTPEGKIGCVFFGVVTSLIVMWAPPCQYK